MESAAQQPGIILMNRSALPTLLQVASAVVAQDNKAFSLPINVHVKCRLTLALGEKRILKG
jgi:hypothetical protein